MYIGFPNIHYSGNPTSLFLRLNGVIMWNIHISVIILFLIIIKICSVVAALFDQWNDNKQIAAGSFHVQISLMYFFQYWLTSSEATRYSIVDFKQEYN